MSDWNKCRKRQIVLNYMLWNQVKEISKTWATVRPKARRSSWILDQMYIKCHLRTAAQWYNVLHADKVTPEWLTLGMIMLCLNNIEGDVIEYTITGRYAAYVKFIDWKIRRIIVRIPGEVKSWHISKSVPSTSANVLRIDSW